MKRKRGLAFLIATILFGLIIISNSTAEAGKDMAGCYFFYVTNVCVPTPSQNYKDWGYIIISLQSDQTVRYQNTTNPTSSDEVGTWFQWGPGPLYMWITKDSACKPLYSGSTQAGYWSCTTGDDEDPGCWFLEKSKKRLLDCPWFDLYE
jgi:hypothetical protein